VCAEALANVLRHNTNLIYLGIRGNKMGDDGVKIIAHALLDNHTVTYMDMIGNEITDVGGQAMTRALKSNGTLLHLRIIFGNKLSSNILTELRSIRRHLIIT
jgi:Ran GTPase-activating protein (RanGAP) involved in mRNA processing and transport